MKTQKALLVVDGRPLLRRLVDVLEPFAPSAVVVTVPARPDARLRDALDGTRATVAVNRYDNAGFFGSIRTAREIVDADVWIVTPVDALGVTTVVITSLLAQIKKTNTTAAIPCWNGERGHPVVVKTSVIDADLNVDGGLQALLARQSGVVDVDVDDSLVVVNLNTRDDVIAAQSRCNIRFPDEDAAMRDSDDDA